MKEKGLDLSGMITAINKRRIAILLFVLIATVSSLLIAFLLPKKYYSAAKLFPANSVLQDKGRLFNPNIQHLYSAFGTGDEIDRLSAVATSDPMYQYLVDSFKLVRHYVIEGKPAESNYKAAQQLKKNQVVKRTVNGELEIGVWDKDNKLAATLSNAMVHGIQIVFDKMLMDINARTWSALSMALSKNSADSTSLRKQMAEIEINMNSHPPVFIVVQNAYPSVKAGSPRILMIVMSSFLISLFIAMLTAIIVEKAR